MSELDAISKLHAFSRQLTPTATALGNALRNYELERRLRKNNKIRSFENEAILFFICLVKDQYNLGLSTFKVDHRSSRQRMCF